MAELTVTINGVTLAEAKKVEAAKALRLAREAKAKREAPAATHMTVRRGGSDCWLLLDPARVRKALARAEKYGGMVSVTEHGEVHFDYTVLTDAAKGYAYDVGKLSKFTV